MATLRKLKLDIAKHHGLKSTTELETIFDSGWYKGRGSGPFENKFRNVYIAHPTNERRQYALSMQSNGAASVSPVNRYK